MMQKIFLFHFHLPFFTFLLLAISYNFSNAQSALEDKIEIYSGIYGKVYYNETIFINQSKSPVQIRSVKARHVPRETAQLAEAVWDQLYRHLADDEKDKIRNLSREKLDITVNASGDDAVAVKFGVIAYDAFKEHLGGLTAVTMDPPTENMQWDFNPAYLFKIKKYGVVAVFVRQVRLSNGEIWNFDAARISSELSKRYSAVQKEDILNSE